jgi:hypothetical protein
MILLLVMFVGVSLALRAYVRKLDACAKTDLLLFFYSSMCVPPSTTCVRLPNKNAYHEYINSTSFSSLTVYRIVVPFHFMSAQVDGVDMDLSY